MIKFQDNERYQVDPELIAAVYCGQQFREIPKPDAPPPAKRKWWQPLERPEMALETLHSLHIHLKHGGGNHDLWYGTNSDARNADYRAIFDATQPTSL